MRTVWGPIGVRRWELSGQGVMLSALCAGLRLSHDAQNATALRGRIAPTARSVKATLEADELQP